MDLLLLIGNTDTKLDHFLQKLGYDVISLTEKQSILEAFSSRVIDLVVIHEEGCEFVLELTDFLRRDEVTRSTSLIILYKNEETREALEGFMGERAEYVPLPLSIGLLASRVATRLRMRKIIGADETKATLAEMNATLRDLNDRLNKERQEARKIQQALLPEFLPKGEKYELGYAYIPLEEVGGDWFFASKTPSGKISLQIADVTGHGLAAAFIGAMTKLAMAAAKEEEPHKLLGEMNRLMSPQMPEGRFVTMGSVLYDPETDKLLSSRAGHPPALLFHRKKNQVVEMKGEGFAIGFFPEGDYSVMEEQLQPGDLLALYTDGIAEVQNRSGEFYGTERIGKILQQSSLEESAEETVKRVLEDLEGFREERVLKDDVTLVILKRYDG